MPKYLHAITLGLSSFFITGTYAFTYGPVTPVNNEREAIGRSVISPDGSQIFFQSSAGLEKIGVSTGVSTMIAEGGGRYDLRLTPDGRVLTWQRRQYDANNRVLVSTERADAQTLLVENGTEAHRGPVIRRRAAADQPEVYIQRGHLMVDEKAIDPQGKGSYVWPSLSPDASKIVYWCVGEGCFVCNLDGSDARHIGGMRAAVWYDDNTLIGMYDRDNGTIITESVLAEYSLSTGEKKFITSNDTICLFPAVSPGRIVCCDALGKLYYIDVRP